MVVAQGHLNHDHSTATRRDHLPSCVKADDSLPHCYSCWLEIVTHLGTVTLLISSSAPDVSEEVTEHCHGRLHPGRTGGSFEYAHVLSHMSEMGGAGISAL
jgi:hypothetical protein